MDQFDRASEQEQQMLEVALRYRKPEAPAGNGQCLHCGEPVRDWRRWCGPDCRDDWERGS